jgi:hypothetical protein
MTLMKNSMLIASATPALEKQVLYDGPVIL